MAKSLLRIEARELRKQGVSIRDITKRLGVAKSTASLWVSDIILSVEQLEKLRQNRVEKTERGRLLGAFKQKAQRLQRTKENRDNALSLLQTLSERELLVSGICLYWAEGTKKRREVSFCNSDVKLIVFMLKWFETILHIPKEQIYCRVGINEAHGAREDRVKKFWSTHTQLPLDQFRKTSFTKTKAQKIYKNYDDHYGVLTIRVLKSAPYYYKIVAMIEALSETGIKQMSG